MSTNSSIKNSIYDPKKVFNKKGMLNEVAIKYRYNLMYINECNKKERKKFNDNNLFGNVKLRLDKDITNFSRKLINEKFEEMTSRVEVINNNINKNGVFEILNEMNHKSMFKSKNISTNRQSADYKEQLEFEQIYKNFKLNENKRISKFNKDLYSVFKNFKEKENLSQSPSPSPGKKLGTYQSIDSFKTNNSIKNNLNCEEIKIKKIRMKNYGKLPKIEKKGSILMNTQSILGFNMINSASVPDIDKQTLYNKQESETVPYVDKSDEELNFKMISLNSKDVQFVKNSLYTKQELKDKKKMKQEKVSQQNTKFTKKRTTLCDLLIDDYPIYNSTESTYLATFESYNNSLDKLNYKSSVNIRNKMNNILDSQTAYKEKKSNLNNYEKKKFKISKLKSNTYYKFGESKFLKMKPTVTEQQDVIYDHVDNQKVVLKLKEKLNVENKRKLKIQNKNLIGILEKINTEFDNFYNQIKIVDYATEEDNLNCKQESRRNYFNDTFTGTNILNRYSSFDSIQ